MRKIMIMLKLLTLLQTALIMEICEANDNTDSSANETNQIPVRPIVATSPVTSDPSMISVPSERNE